MKVPLQAGGLMHYAALAQELRRRLAWCGLAECSDEERTRRVSQLYWLRVWTWMAVSLVLLVGVWMVLR